MRHSCLGAIVACALIAPPAAASSEDDWDGLLRALIDDGTTTIHFRTYYFDRDKPGNIENAA